MDEMETNIVEETEGEQSRPRVEVVDIQFRPGQKVYYFDPCGLTLHPGDHVIIDTARGEEFGHCTGANHFIRPSEVVAPLRPVLRMATSRDERIRADNLEREKYAFALCYQKIQDLGLDMQLICAECAFDGSKILFFFTADQRVDFRELVKNLAYQLHSRIELRQIGVRDKAKMVGGLGICGRPFCCISFLSDFQPVSIKMAKTQNLSLNPAKISGTCGRLMCCLKYEQEAYEDLLKTSPKMDSFVDTPAGRGTIVDVNLLRQQVRVRMEKEPDTISTFANSEIAVLRSGKARKNDPPIPEDMAPISGGNGQPPRKEPENETPEAPALEPVRLRYSAETLEPEQPVREERTPRQEDRPYRRRRRPEGSGDQRRPEGSGEARPPRKEKRPAPENGEKPRKAPRPEQPEQEASQRPHRSNNYRRNYKPRKPKSPEGGG